MRLWRFGKLSKSTSDERSSDTTSRELPLESSGATAESDYECLWVLVCVTFRQILPRINSYFCVNESGELALMALPDFAVSKTSARLMYEPGRTGVVLMQRILQGEDKSYLVPVTLTAKQASILGKVIGHFRKSEPSKGIRKHDWHEFVSEIRAQNHLYLGDRSCWHDIRRMKVVDNAGPKIPDEFQVDGCFVHGIPVFVYTDLGEERVQSRLDLQREIFVTRLVADNNIESVVNAIRNSPAWGNLDESDEFVHVINRAEVEIKLHMRSSPSFADIMLNSEMAEFIPGPPPDLRFTSKGEAMLRQTASRQIMSSVSNWGDPNIAQVALHVSRSRGQSPKDSLTAPSITVFRDELGIHALRATLFRSRGVSTSTTTESAEPLFLDAVPASQIPEISWEPIADEEPSEWWQTDTVAKKVLWLATYNLASHAIGDPEPLIYSVTPIGNDVIQVALLFDALEEGAPYAFAIIRDDFAITAIPVFPTGTYEVQSDGALVAKKALFLKNYCITRNGERIDLLETGQIMQFIEPIFSTVVSGKYRQHEI